MKHLYLILIFMWWGCGAQSITKPLFMKGGSKIDGAYYKDVDGDFDDFVGTWVYNNGASNLTIILKKRNMVFDPQSNIYIDYLIGEYKYIENGIEKINTLSNLNVQYEDSYNYNIAGCSIIKATAAPVCDDCSPNQRRVSLMFSDPTRPGIQQGLSGRITFRRADNGNTKRIVGLLRQTGSVIPDDDETPTHNAFNVPWGEYTLTKVN